MKSIQYTVRNIPQKVDLELRKQAKKRGVSFNQTLVDALKRGSGVTDSPVHYDDLDWFIGSIKTKSPELEEAMKWLDSLPSEIEITHE